MRSGGPVRCRRISRISFRIVFRECLIVWRLGWSGLSCAWVLWLWGLLLLIGILCRPMGSLGILHYRSILFRWNNPNHIHPHFWDCHHRISIRIFYHRHKLRDRKLIQFLIYPLFQWQIRKHMMCTHFHFYICCNTRCIFCTLKSNWKILWDSFYWQYIDCFTEYLMGLNMWDNASYLDLSKFRMNYDKPCKMRFQCCLDSSHRILNCNCTFHP